MAEKNRMKRARWLFVAAAVAGIVVLVAPAVGQGKAASRSLEWSRSRGGPTITSYDFGAVDGGSSVTRGFRLASSALTKSGKLAISLTGSSAFSITSDHCTGKGIGPNLSCWVAVDYAPLGAGTSDSATLRAESVDGAAARVSLSGSSAGPSGHVYWSTDSWFGGDAAVKTVPRGGGSLTTLAVGYHPGPVAVDGTNVYWIDSGPYPGNNGTVNEVPVGGGPVTTLASGQNGPSALAVDGAHVYWVNSDCCVSNGTVNEVPIGGGPVTTLASGQDRPSAVAVDGTHVYWVNAGDCCAWNGTVNEVPVGGGTVTTLATGQIGPTSVAVDGTHVYWTAGGAVHEVPVGGGTVTTLATGQSPSYLAVDGTRVYWVDFGGTVNEVPVGGGTVTTLATGQNPSSLAVDSTHAYWVNGGRSWPPSGTVNKVRLGGGPVVTLALGQGTPTAVAVGP